uniref:Mannitol dehydrogenase C-terminal domain-containing protein n=1 Tax=Chromera velia CCMP2878 TaxID=1169474 RepID=A0A0G4FY26_9ALVE|eukprot:Cvel_3866.t1-p1 / transcript=Cvel_3866.t1 / gene=Cvel_3866 / organism=Chromera_velia_CCMP2878 / gene_product=hypothetical protein / transcript_product=hypothetical protein / location=Cvel_scaffold163:102493-109169(+) / protein_length=578 / sequence_SO=supercontig / SO=protein_coding / is_pseudo=false
MTRTNSFSPLSEMKRTLVLLALVLTLLHPSAAFSAAVGPLSRRHHWGGAGHTQCQRQSPEQQAHVLQRLSEERDEQSEAAVVNDLIAESFEKLRAGQSRKTVHIHFGAGKLGLGLVLKAMAKSAEATSSQLVLLQRASNAWKSVVDCDSPYIRFALNSTEICRLRVIRPGDPLDFEEIVQGARENAASKGHAGYFILHGSGEEEKTKLQQLLDWAVSDESPLAAVFSTSLGPALHKATEPLLSRLPKRKEAAERPALYACENDHVAVEKLAEKLKGKVTVVPCMVDRICAERTIGKCADGTCDVSVVAEPFPGEIVLLSPPEHAQMPAFRGNNVHCPEDEREAHYFCERKKLMVNGMHTTLAFMTLAKEQPLDFMKISGYDSETLAPGDHELVNWAQGTEEDRRMMWNWAVARCILCCHQHTVDVIKSAHGVTSDEEVCRILLAYARSTLDRFSTVRDTTSRVLGGGIHNRFVGRLANLRDFVESSDFEDSPIRQKMMEMAGVSDASLKEDVRALVKAALPHAQLDKERRDKQEQLPFSKVPTYIGSVMAQIDSDDEKERKAQARKTSWLRQYFWGLG